MTDPDWDAYKRLGRLRSHDEHAAWMIALQRDPQTLEADPAEIAWEVSPDGDELTSHLCHVISHGTDDVCYLAYYNSDMDGAHTTFVRMFERPEQLEPFRHQGLGIGGMAIAAFENYIDYGACDDGHAVLSYYVHGADLVALREAGSTLSWPTACLLYAAATAPLRALHATGRVHGALTARRVRLALAPEHGANWGAGYAPSVRYMAHHGREGTPDEAAGELCVVATAVLAMARHPDRAIDRLLREEPPESQGANFDVLRDLLLERDQPIDALIADRTGLAGTLPVIRWQDDPVIDLELAELWKRAILIDPMMEDRDDRDDRDDPDEAD